MTHEELQIEQYSMPFISELVSIYSTRREALVERLRLADLSSPARFKAESLLAQIDAEVAFLNSKTRKWASKTTTGMYRYGMGLAATSLFFEGFPTRKVVLSPFHKQAVQVLADNITVTMLAANQSWASSLKRVIRSTQQTILSEGFINRAVAAGIMEGVPRKQVSNEILFGFLNNLNGADVVYARGRKFSPTYYAELVARTQTREAVTEGSINQGVEWGADLVTMSKHVGACDKCTPYEGRTFSVDGRNPDFPKLERRTPIHPNCRHVMLPRFSEALRARDLYHMESVRSLAA